MGIKIINSFDLNSPLPLDARAVANNINEMNELITKNFVVAGQMCYNKADNKLYVLKKNSEGALLSWHEVVDSVDLDNINKVLPTDIAVKDNKLGLEHDNVWLTNQNAINLGDNMTYDATTKTLNAKGGGGGESVSPTLYLFSFQDGGPRTTITEQEKTNLEKGLYNQVVYAETIEDAFPLYTPSKLFSIMGTFIFEVISGFHKYVETGEQGGYTTITQYGLQIGEKNSNNEYPITIIKASDFQLGDYKSINLFGNHSILVPNASTDTNIDLYNHFIKITGTKDTTQVIARFTIQSSNNLVVDTPEKLTTLLGNEFELGCNGIYGNYNITGLKKTADGTLNIIYNNGGAESLQSVARLTISISDTVKTV